MPNMYVITFVVISHSLNISQWIISTIKYHSAFLEVPYVLTCVLNDVYTTKISFNAASYGMLLKHLYPIDRHHVPATCIMVPDVWHVPEVGCISLKQACM